MGDSIVFSILLIVLGTVFGVLLVLIFNYITKKINNKKAEDIIENAKKEAEKIKRDSLFETKEDIHKLKLETEKELKEKKKEIKDSEDRLLQRENMDFQTHLYRYGEMEEYLKECGFKSVSTYSNFRKEIAVNDKICREIDKKVRQHYGISKEEKKDNKEEK